VLFRFSFWVGRVRLSPLVALVWGIALFFILVAFISPVSASEILSQFRLPTPSKAGEPPKLLPKQLPYQYGYGSGIEIRYRKDPDLNARIWDHSSVIQPEITGYIIYRPTDWLDTSLFLIAGKEIPLAKERVILLPDESLLTPDLHKTSLRADEAYLTIKKVFAPFELKVGRQSFSDDLNLLYDTSLDMITLSLNRKIRADISAGREILFHLDTLKERPDRIDTYLLYMEYRGIENIKLAGYSVLRRDKSRIEGRPWLTGLRSTGAPTFNFKYWADVAHLGGKDEGFVGYKAYAFDLGSVYRAEGLLGNPHVITGFAYATGDNPKDKKNNEFRQTGLQSNDVTFVGSIPLQRYGAALESELSNLRVITAGLGFRIGPDAVVNLIYHRYRVNQVAEDVNGARLTALMNQDISRRATRDMGGALDMGIGMSNLFGVRKLGLEIKGGVFYPGPGYRNLVITDEGDERFVLPDRGIAVSTKLEW